MDRYSQHAGSWYEGKRELLQNQIHKLFLNKWGYGKDPLEHPEDRKYEEHVLGIISPHAGYMYSGPIASHGYAAIFNEFESLDTVIILGPNHSGRGPEISIFPEGKWHNPLGTVKIDEEVTDFAKTYDFGDIQDMIGFETSAHQSEHSIDIQLPFLQYLYDKKPFEVVPICLLNQSLNYVVKGLSKFFQNYIEGHKEKKILIVASSDFSHEYNYNIVVNNDKGMIKRLVKADLEEAEEFRQKAQVTMCGYGPVFTLIQTAKRMGKADVNLLKYANSTDIYPPGGGYTVGYASIAVKVES